MSFRWASTLACVALCLAMAPPSLSSATPRSHSHHAHSYHARTHSPRTHQRSHTVRSSRHTRSYTYGVPRDKHGRIKRSEAAKREFERETGYPHGRPGYVVDHIIPLSKGGKDDPSNMQWQTIEQAKEKDKTERK